MTTPDYQSFPHVPLKQLVRQWFQPAPLNQPITTNPRHLHARPNNTPSTSALLLLGELSGVSGCGDRVSSLLPLCAETLRHKHYPQHINFLETLLKLLPVFAKSLGKRVFKRHLELFLDSIFYGLSSDNALVQSAGVDCLTSLCQLLGKMILRGRIEQHNPTYLDKFDRTVTVV
ncbi:uncharacterized protein LOC135349686 isoform X2 [Halichondria panicea]|uniref:uncharacterized protein LOC135349686 isoform X2 n=1 Tax=Halichondria panicea TaxID=6063 RepID=UPI00312B2DB9